MKIPKLNIKMPKIPKIPKISIPIIIVLITAIIAAGLLLGKTDIGKAFMEKSRVIFTELATKLKLDRIPFLKRFVKEGAMPVAPDEMP